MRDSDSFLDDIVEFDCPFTITEQGTVSAKRPGVYAPNLLDGQLDDPSWEMIGGYSGQDRYSGPIMHNSEYLGGELARDILSEPGVYCLVVAYWSPDEDDYGGEDQPFYAEGWAICRRRNEV